MKKYWTIAKLSWSSVLEYRASFLWSVLLNFFLIFAYYFLWKAVYAGQDKLAGFTLEMAIGYIMLALPLNYLTRSSMSKKLEGDIRNGELSFKLVKPYHPLVEIAIQAWSRSAMRALWFGLGLFLASLFLPAYLRPAHWWTFLLGLLAVVVAKYMGTLFDMMVGCLSFWIIEITFFRHFNRWGVRFLAGGVLPLAFFPDMVVGVFQWLPFRFMIDWPVNLYLGNNLDNWWLDVLLLLGWMVGLTFILGWTFRRGYFRYESVGG